MTLVVSSEVLGVGLYCRGARCRAVVAADAWPAPQTRVHSHEVREVIRSSRRSRLRRRVEEEAEHH